jgi:hypothetical protein
VGIDCELCAVLQFFTMLQNAYGSDFCKLLLPITLIDCSKLRMIPTGCISGSEVFARAPSFAASNRSMFLYPCRQCMSEGRGMMKFTHGGTMTAFVLSDLIESREVEIQCGHCEWKEPRPLRWLGSRRDMVCPECRGVIVLNTSKRRHEIASMRRQILELHEQLADMMAAGDILARRARTPVRGVPSAPKLELALSRVARSGMIRRPT